MTWCRMSSVFLDSAYFLSYTFLLTTLNCSEVCASWSKPMACFSLMFYQFLIVLQCCQVLILIVLFCCWVSECWSVQYICNYCQCAMFSKSSLVQACEYSVLHLHLCSKCPAVLKHVQREIYSNLTLILNFSVFLFPSGCVCVCLSMCVCVCVSGCLCVWESIYYFVRWRQHQNLSDFLFAFYYKFLWVEGVFERTFTVLLGEGKFRILVICFLSFIKNFWELWVCMCGCVWQSIYCFVRWRQD